MEVARAPQRALMPAPMALLSPQYRAVAVAVAVVAAAAVAAAAVAAVTAAAAAAAAATTTTLMVVPMPSARSIAMIVLPAATMVTAASIPQILFGSASPRL